MTTPHNSDQLIKTYLADGPVELPDRSFETVRDTIERTRQRGAFGGWRLPRVSDSARLVAVAALTLIAIVGISVIGPGGQRNRGAPDSSADPSGSVEPASSADPSSSPAAPASANPSADPGANPSGAAPSDSLGPSPTPAPVPDQSLGPDGGPTSVDEPTIEGGVLRVSSGFPVAATLEVPDDWVPCLNTPFEQGACGSSEVNFMVVDNVVADMCVDRGLDPPIARTADDFIAAIAALPGFELTSPTDVTVDGHPGKDLTVTAPREPTCGIFTWSNVYRTNGVGAGEANRIRIFEIDGLLILLAAPFHPPEGTSVLPADAEQVFLSARFP
jgi:hypothetical protein